MDRDQFERLLANGEHVQDIVDQYDRINKAAKDKIHKFCAGNHLLKKFGDELFDKLMIQEDQIGTDIWCQDQFDKKVQQQLVKSVTNFINYLQANQVLRIKVYNGQLVFYCKIRLGKDVGYKITEIMRTKILQQTIFTYFDPIKYHKNHIPRKIQQIFRKLYESLRIFLNKNYKNFNKSLGLYQINYLLFRPNQLNQQEKLNFIHIGGLSECCFRFFRVLFQFLFSQSENFLLYDVRKRTHQFCQREQIFIGKFLNKIQNKLKEIQELKQSSASLIQKKIDQQMKEFKYQKVLNYFIQNAAKIGQQRNIYEESSKIYRCQKILSKISKPEMIDTTIIVEQFCRPQPSKMYLEGLIEHKRKNEENKHQIDLKLLIRQQSKFSDYFPQYNKKRFQDQEVISAHYSKTQIQIQKSGSFKIVTEEFEQSFFQQVFELLKNIYPNYNVHEVPGRRLVLTAYLGLKNIDLKQLADLPQFVGKIDFLTGQRLNLINQRKKAKKDINKAISSIRNPNGLRFARKISQQLPNINYQSNQKYQIKFIIYKFSKISWDENIHDTYEQQMFMTISDQGQVKIYNVTDFLFAEEEFMKIQKSIRQNYNKE